MRTVYVLSQYPARSETFIAREMQELTSRGHDLTIARLRWSDTQAGLEVPYAEVLPLHWNPLQWILGMKWAAFQAPRSLLQIGRDLLDTVRPSAPWARLLVLSLISISLARTLSNQSVTHIRAHFLDSEAIAAYWMSQLLDVPFSITVHTLSTRRFPTVLLQRVAQNASFIGAENEQVKERMPELATSSNPIHLIRPGIRFSDTHASSFSSPSPPWNLLAVGRLIEKKGFDTLLEACQYLKCWNCAFYCHIIGGGPLRDHLEVRARELGVKDRVAFHGAQPNEEVLRAMQKYDVLVMPSRPTVDGARDGIPTVLLEAMSYATPVVASNFAGIPELVEDDVTGKLVPPNAPLPLARALQRLFEDADQACRLGRNGRKRIRRDFNLKREVKKIDTLVKQNTAK